jgi:signal peptidase II
MNSQNFFTVKKLFFLGTIIVFFVAFFDLLTKRIIFSALENIASVSNIPNPEIKITDFFSLVYVRNYGVSFGMFSKLANSNIIFSIVQFSIAFVLFFWLYRNQKPSTAYALSFIIGGALGNVIDRIKNGAVADFLDFHIGIYHWPAFNLADSAVFIGVTILLLEDFFFKKK